jgi:spermidine synthase
VLTPAAHFRLLRSTEWTCSTLFIVFFLSGLASLLYQIAWQRLLTVYYGVGSISITLIVSVYLLGLGLGALLGGFLAERIPRKLALYAAIEAAIAGFGILSPILLDTLGKKTAGGPYAVTAAYIFLFLSVPTLLMGTTLPLLTKIYNSIEGNFARTVSTLYFANTLGAAIGALLGSYLLISFLGLANTVRIAAVINIILPALILLSGRNPSRPLQETSLPYRNAANLPRGALYALVLCTGFLAIGYEIIWFRMLSVLVKDSPYAFSTILCEYLLGIASGSFLLAKVLERYPHVNRRDLFLQLQSLIAAFVFVSVTVYFYCTKYTMLSIPSRASFTADIHPGMGYTGLLPLFPLVDIFIWPAAFILIPTVLMGASFPLVASLGMRNENREGDAVGRVYFVTVIGNVLGGIITGFVLLPLIKTEGTLLLFVSIGLVVGMSLKQRYFKLAVASLLVAGIILFPRAGDLYTTMHFPPGEGYQFYLEEGREGVVGTYVRGESVITYINGSPHGGRPDFSFHARALEAFGHAPKARNVLVIGYGTGSFVETALRADALSHLTLVEINSVLIRNSMKVDVLRKMLQDSRVEVVIEDGRRFLLRTDRTFDVIMLDPLRSKTSGSNNLYSSQFFDLLKRHLNPSGVFMLWTDEFTVIPRTLASVFKNVRFYTNNLLLAAEAPFGVNASLRAAILANFTELDQQRIQKVNQAFIGNQEYIRARTAGHAINEDWVPVTEYFLGLRFREFRDRIGRALAVRP